MSDCLISFGSNLGESERVIREAAEKIAAVAGPIQLGDFYRTAPIGGPIGQPDFVNGVGRLQSNLSPQALLQNLLEIEKSLGRQRRVRWDARTIDMDILLFGDLILDLPECTIPHPRMSFRRFVLEPALTIAPAAWHPVCQVTLKDLVTCLDQRPDKILITGERNSNWPDLKNLESIVDPFELVLIPESNPAIDWLKVNQAKLMMVIRSDGQRVDTEAASLASNGVATLDDERFQWHRGPILHLRPDSVSEFETELRAAVSAMQPLN